MREGKPDVPGDTALPISGWRRFLAWWAEIEAAMDVSYDEIQDRRIRALEQKVAELRGKLSPP